MPMHNYENTFIREDLVSQIMEAGFEREQAIKALKKARNNVNLAFDLLLSDRPLSDDEDEHLSSSVVTSTSHHHRNYNTDSDTATTSTSEGERSPFHSPTTIHQQQNFEIYDQQTNNNSNSSNQQQRSTNNSSSSSESNQQQHSYPITNTHDLTTTSSVVYHMEDDESANFYNHANDPDFFYDEDEIINHRENSQQQQQRNNSNHSNNSNNNNNYHDIPEVVTQPTTSRTIMSSGSGANNSSSSRNNNLNSSYEDALNRAIQASLQDQKKDSEPKTPKEKFRKFFHTPIGLKNIGNTCYVNSLLQTYFLIPTFRQLVFSFNELDFIKKIELRLNSLQQSLQQNVQQNLQNVNLQMEKIKKQAEKDLNFMKELQRLFCGLILSNRTFIDPSNLVIALKEEGVDVNIGFQEDISEFNHKILILLEKMFSDDQNIDKVEKKLTNTINLNNPIKKIFYGICIEEYECEDLDKTILKIQNQVEICNLILNISEELKDFYSSLDNYTSQELVEFTTERQFKTQAIKTIWFKSLPPVLLVQLQRTSFDKKSGIANKITLPFEFPDIVYIDRYLECNKDITIGKRDKIREIKERIKNLESELYSYLNYKDKCDISLEFMISGTIDYIKQHFTNTNNNTSNNNNNTNSNNNNNDNIIIDKNYLNILENVKQHVIQKVEQLKHEIKSLNEQVNTMFNDMNKQPYELLAILIHEGSLAQSGHYFIYYHDFEQDCWWKFNDIKVTKVTEEEVMRISKGMDNANNTTSNTGSGSSSSGGTCTSAYCLIYIDKERIQVAQEIFLEHMSKETNVNIEKLKEEYLLVKTMEDNAIVNDTLQSTSDNNEEEKEEEDELTFKATPITTLDIYSDIIKEKWKGLIPNEIQEEIQEQNKKLIEEINEWIEEQKTKREKERKYFQHQYHEICNKCVQICQGQVSSTYIYSMSLQNDARIASLPVFLCAINEMKAMKFTIAEQVFEKLFNRRFIDLFYKSTEKADFKKFNEYMSLIDLTIDDIPESKRMSQLNELYALFCFVARWYYEGLLYLYRKTFDRAMHSFQMAIIYDRELMNFINKLSNQSTTNTDNTNNNNNNNTDNNNNKKEGSITNTTIIDNIKLSREKDIITYAAVCLQQVFSRGLKIITKNFEEAMTWIKYAIDNLPFVWNHNIQTNEFIMDKILLYYPTFINENQVKIQLMCDKFQIDEIVEYWKYLQQSPIMKNYNLRKQLKQLLDQLQQNNNTNNKDVVNNKESIKKIKQVKRSIKQVNRELRELKQLILDENKERYHVPFPDDGEQLANSISNAIHNVEMEYARDIQIHPMYNSETDLLVDNEEEEDISDDEEEENENNEQREIVVNKNVEEDDNLQQQQQEEEYEGYNDEQQESYVVDSSQNVEEYND
ncbi:hypothetical protein ABK040_005617 [Willaertia magna]